MAQEMELVETVEMECDSEESEMEGKKIILYYIIA